MNSNIFQNSEIISLKCVIIGDANSGKTSLINRYINSYFNQFDIAPTIGSSFSHKTIHRNNKTYRIDIWDTAGQERYRSLMPMYYRKADIIFICFDLSSTNCSRQIEYWLSEVNKFLTTKIILVGTKSDMKIEQKIDTKNLDYFETSAKLAQNVTEMFDRCLNETCDTKVQYKTSMEIVLQEPQETQETKNCGICTIQ